MTPAEGKLEAVFVPPIRVVETVPMVYLSNPKPNVYIYDCGKVTAGWAKLTLTAQAGVSVKLIYGEKLQPDGRLDIWKEGYDHQFWENAQEDIYVCKGEGEEIWEPKFSYKGFRYVQIESLCDIGDLKLEAQVFHNDVEAIGRFESSNGLFNRIHHAMVDTMLNNFHSIPTDTPFHEKRGWLGDAQAIAECAAMNLDITAFFAKWLQDIADSQDENGAVCHTAPGPFLYMTPTPAWMSAFIIIPWTLYEYYGDRDTLRQALFRHEAVFAIRVGSSRRRDEHGRELCGLGGTGSVHRPGRRGCARDRLRQLFVRLNGEDRRRTGA